MRHAMDLCVRTLVKCAGNCFLQTRARNYYLLQFRVNLKECKKLFMLNVQEIIYCIHVESNHIVTLSTIQVPDITPSPHAVNVCQK